MWNLDRGPIALLLISLFLMAPSAQASEKEGVLRVGGDYRVEDISKVDSRTFRISFVHNEAIRHQRLVLLSDHVHLGVEVGQILRLSAEIAEEKDGYFEVSQVLLFLPSQYGKTPIWMLSATRPRPFLGGVKLLEMHAPAADYAIF